MTTIVKCKGYRYRKTIHTGAPVECDSCGSAGLIRVTDRCFELRTDGGREMKLCVPCGMKHLPQQRRPK